MPRSAADLPVHLIVGPAEHGVNAYAAELAGVLGAPVLRRAHFSEVEPSGLPPRMHLHVTDHLLGSSPAEAADLIERLSASAQHLGVTLHDIPQSSDGERNFPRRTEAYGRIIAAADLVIVNSEHELRLLEEAGALEAGSPAGGIAVVPLPLPVLPAGEEIPDAPGQRTLAVFGYIYPGKGYEEAIDAAAAQESPLRVAALGRVAEGCDWLAEQLKQRAEQRGVGFEIAGFIPDEELVPRLRAADVPVCFHQHFSASGSINTWIAAGRRPIAPRVRYTEEMERLRPGTLTLVEPEDLPAAVAAALADPASTRLDPASLPHTLADAAAEYRRLLAAAPAAPSVSIVIPYFAAAGESLPQQRLDLILAALAAQQDAFRDLVVANDGSAVPPVLPADLPFPASIVRQEDEGFRAAAARNLGAGATTGDVLVFLDADTVPQPGFVAALTAPLLEDEADLSVGRRRHAHLTGPRAGEELADPAWLRDAYARTENLRAGDARAYQLVISAVLAVRRSAFEAIGGFDESLVGYGGEDWVLAHRLWESGARFLHAPEAVAVHDGPDWGERGGRSDAEQLAVKNAETRALAHRIPATWTRPPGIRFRSPELRVLLSVTEIHDDDAAAAWVGALFAAHPDAELRLSAGFERVWDLCGEDARVRSALTREAWAPARFTLTVQRLFDPAELGAALSGLDAAPENGPLGGPLRRARLMVDGEPAADLVSTRAAAMGSAETPGPWLEQSVAAWPESVDLERTWAGW